MKIFLFLLLFISKVALADDIDILADTAFFEDRGGGYNGWVAVMEATKNRAHRYHRNLYDTVYYKGYYSYISPRTHKRIYTTKLVYHYTWVCMNSAWRSNKIANEWNVYKVIKDIAKTVYNIKRNRVLKHKQDHFLSVELARSGKAPRWFKYECPYKERYGNHIFCRYKKNKDLKYDS